MRFERNQARENVFSGYADARPVAQEGMEVRMGFLKKVYSLFFASVFMACGGAYVGMPMAYTVANNNWTFLFLWIGLLFFANVVKKKQGLNMLALFAFAGFGGLLTTPLLAFAATTHPELITQAFAMTVGIFGGLTAYVFIARKDFGFMGGFLFVGLISLVVGGLLNLFFIHSPAIQFAMSAVGVLIFSGYILYDTSNIIKRYPSDEYVAGAIDLYLDFLLLFMHLLNLLLAMSGDD